MRGAERIGCVVVCMQNPFNNNALPLIKCDHANRSLQSAGRCANARVRVRLCVSHIHEPAHRLYNACSAHSLMSVCACVRVQMPAVLHGNANTRSQRVS